MGLKEAFQVKPEPGLDIRPSTLKALADFSLPLLFEKLSTKAGWSDYENQALLDELLGQVKDDRSLGNEAVLEEAVLDNLWIELQKPYEQIQEGQYCRRLAAKVLLELDPELEQLKIENTDEERGLHQLLLVSKIWQVDKSLDQEGVEKRSRLVEGILALGEHNFKSDLMTNETSKAYYGLRELTLEEKLLNEEEVDWPRELSLLSQASGFDWHRLFILSNIPEEVGLGGRKIYTVLADFSPEVKADFFENPERYQQALTRVIDRLPKDDPWGAEAGNLLGLRFIHRLLVLDQRDSMENKINLEALSQALGFHAESQVNIRGMSLRILAIMMNEYCLSGESVWPRQINRVIEAFEQLAAKTELTSLTKAAKKAFELATPDVAKSGIIKSIILEVLMSNKAYVESRFKNGQLKLVKAFKNMRELVDQDRMKELKDVLIKKGYETAMVAEVYEALGDNE